ncbi:MAG: hypothetical protein M3O20_01185 [Acidobacteriota bacterium]|nr:hypothetical protein [Acidobacteriota bacterium]
MLPNHVLSTTVESAQFLPPKTNTVKAALTDFTLGPIAAGDGSHGIDYQHWRVGTDGANNVIFTPLTTGSPLTAYVGTDVITWVSGTFDQGGRPQVAFIIQSAAYFYWFDTLSNAYQLTLLPDGAVNPYICLDDVRALQSSTSDVVVCYVNADYLFFRAQRDRYQIEYNLGYIGAGTLLTQAGPNIGNRFQFQFQSLLADQNLKFTKFVASKTFKPILVIDAKGIKPRIWKPHDNVTVRRS